MGGRRKQADKTFEFFHGIGPSADLELELAPGTHSGYVGVSPEPRGTGRFQAWVFYSGKKRIVGSFESTHEAAIQRALALRNENIPDSPPPRKQRVGTMVACEKAHADDLDLDGDPTMDWISLHASAMDGVDFERALDA